MNYQVKTKAELIKELQKLQQETEALKTSYLKDIAERKQAEEKIRPASLYARNLIEASLDPLVTISKDGKITDVNFSTEQITGIKRNKLIGSDFADYFKESDKAKEGYNVVFSKGVVKDYPLTIIHTSGREIAVLYNATLFRNEAGEVQGVFAAARDITEQKKMEEELRNSKELLEKLNEHLVDVRENERNQISEPEEFVLEDRPSLIIYRILQESLTNIARHSGASIVEVNLRILKKKIKMLVEDDGCGIEKSKVDSLRSMGIAGMKERVKSVQGKITFRGERGSGTRIEVIVPLIHEMNND